MDILEHPLEAVAFRLYSLPDSSAATGAAAWTCLAAVLTAAAAAGLWRLRSSAPAASAAALKPLDLEPPNVKEEASPEPASSSPDSAASTAAPSPKERYTAYYRDSGRVGCCEVDMGDEEEDYEEEEAEEQDEDEDDVGVYRTPEKTTGPFGWEHEVVRSLPLSPTTAEMRRYRSRRALSSSSVVRLWDDAVDAAASPRRRSRVVGTVSAF